METLKALCTRRSIRRFTAQPVEKQAIKTIMECARFYPCPANLQPLKFALLTDTQQIRQGLSNLYWAGYLPEYTLEEADYPTALLLILGDKSVSKDFEFSAGAAANQILLAATDLGLASCCLGMSQKAKLAFLDLLGKNPEDFDMLYAVAIGHSTQKSTAVDMEQNCRYWQDAQGNFLVPKRKAEEIFLKME